MPRPRKPTRQKKLEGTARPDRENRAEPQFEAAIPDPPEWLSAAGIAAWNEAAHELHAHRVLARTDKAVLACYAECFAEVGEFTERINAGQRFLTDSDDDEGGARKYPLVKERREAMARLQSLAGELGLSPASRSKVSSIKGDSKGDPMAAPPREARKPHRSQPGDLPN